VDGLADMENDLAAMQIKTTFKAALAVQISELHTFAEAEHGWLVGLLRANVKDAEHLFRTIGFRSREMMAVVHGRLEGLVHGIDEAANSDQPPATASVLSGLTDKIKAISKEVDKILKVFPDNFLETY